jgi:K+-transporting ATPase c subunit
MRQQSRNALQTSVVAGAVAPFVLALIGALFSNTSNGSSVTR